MKRRKCNIHISPAHSTAKSPHVNLDSDIIRKILLVCFANVQSFRGIRGGAAVVVTLPAREGGGGGGGGDVLGMAMAVVVFVLVVVLLHVLVVMVCVVVSWQRWWFVFW